MARRRDADPLAKLTAEQLSELCHGDGRTVKALLDPDRPSEFASDAERRQAWERHREAVLEAYRGHDRRPWAWWRYERGEDCPGHIASEVPLARRAEYPWPWKPADIRVHELGEMTEEELQELREREDPDLLFERATVTPGPRYCGYGIGTLSDADLAALRAWGERKGGRKLEQVNRRIDRELDARSGRLQAAE